MSNIGDRLRFRPSDEIRDMNTRVARNPIPATEFYEGTIIRFKESDGLRYPVVLLDIEGVDFRYEVFGPGEEVEKT